MAEPLANPLPQMGGHTSSVEQVPYADRGPAGVEGFRPYFQQHQLSEGPMHGAGPATMSHAAGYFPPPMHPQGGGAVAYAGDRAFEYMPMPDAGPRHAPGPGGFSATGQSLAGVPGAGGFMQHLGPAEAAIQHSGLENMPERQAAGLSPWVRSGDEEIDRADAEAAAAVRSGTAGALGQMRPMKSFVAPTFASAASCLPLRLRAVRFHNLQSGDVFFESPAPASVLPPPLGTAAPPRLNSWPEPSDKGSDSGARPGAGDQGPAGDQTDALDPAHGWMPRNQLFVYTFAREELASGGMDAVAVSLTLESGEKGFRNLRLIETFFHHPRANASSTSPKAGAMANPKSEPDMTAPGGGPAAGADDTATGPPPRVLRRFSFSHGRVPPKAVLRWDTVYDSLAPTFAQLLEAPHLLADDDGEIRIYGDAFLYDEEELIAHNKCVVSLAPDPSQSNPFDLDVFDG
ncbi:hypothetical protein H696_00922 [Fonticula alba]|uniref:Uncharacterized protein n=1 Tax=Fonticula alba TaxID=691883 RepID=A0A058ZHG7_FONAL|nr:hypothetical protein H696_00922 [Fonticula alba]KCV73383.1 hypothetical protein H696_00922 [Fonticula alba]|eukprot:XP_009493084.1 hypothetical protein H696_00922 [Fonticula alba]